MKKLFFAMLITMLFILMGCTDNSGETTMLPPDSSITEPDEKDEDEVEDIVEEDEEIEDIKDEDNETEDTTVEDEEMEDTSDSSEDDVETSSTSSASTLPDLTDAVMLSTATTVEDPVKFGQWAEHTLYSPTSKTEHSCYVKLTKVSRFSEDEDYIMSCIEEHNNNTTAYSSIDLEEINMPADVEFCILEYDIYVPEGFPHPDYGMTFSNIWFTVKNIAGGGIPSADGSSTYLALGESRKMHLDGDDLQMSGAVYSFRNYFFMVKGFNDFIIDSRCYPDGTHSDETSIDLMRTIYFDWK